MRSLTPIRWGILGTGWVAQRFMADLRAVDGTRPVALASRSADRAQTVAATFGISRFHSSYEGLFSDSEVDVIYIATEHHEHAKHCASALRAGKAILCEKPFATTFSEAQEVVALAREKRLFCMEAMWSRFLPGTLDMKRRIDSGAIGTPSLICADFGYPVAETEAATRFFDPHRGGGALLDRGVYAIALATWLFGRPSSILAKSDTHPLGTDRSISVILQFADNQMAVLLATLGALTSNQATVSGNRGRITLAEPFYRPEKVIVTQARTADGTPSVDIRPGTARELIRQAIAKAKPYLPLKLQRTGIHRYSVNGYGYGYEAAEVVRCIREGLLESPLMPATDTLLVMETLDRIRQQLSK